MIPEAEEKVQEEKNVSETEKITESSTEIVFSRKFRGYDPREVDIELDCLLENVQELKSENDKLRFLAEKYKRFNSDLVMKINLLEEEQNEKNRYLWSIFQKADVSAEQTIEQAKTTASKISADAQQKWNETRDSALETVRYAQTQGEQIIMDAKSKAEQITSEADSKLADISRKAMRIAELTGHLQLKDLLMLEDAVLIQN